MIRQLSGLEPGKLSTNSIVIQPGSLTGWDGALYERSTAAYVDLTINGATGLDTGSVSAGDLFLYAIHDATSWCFIASKAKAAGDVVVPAGYTLIRKLPWGVIYNPAWDGLPNHHVAHWPSPMITLTDSETSGAWCALSLGTATTWTDIDLSPWIPDNARIAYISCQTKYLSATGSAYIRSYSGQPTGMLIGSVAANSVFQTNTQLIRISSTRKLQYQLNSPGIRLSIYVLGYCQTEPA